MRSLKVRTLRKKKQLKMGNRLRTRGEEGTNVLKGEGNLLEGLGVD